MSPSHTLHSLTDLSLKDVINLAASRSFTAGARSQTNGVTELPITELPSSPRHSHSSLTGPHTLSSSLRNLHAFRDLFVHRKRISIGVVLKEGESSPPPFTSVLL